VLECGERIPLFEPWPYSYYTCARKIDDKQTDWYCTKGRYEFVYSVGIEHQTMRFCKFRKNKERIIKSILDTDKVIIT
jgi:hypothetical protein